MIEIANGITKIGDYAFSGTSSLNSITLPNTLSIIGVSAFMGASSLSSITIPNSVISIGSYAFRDCLQLVSVKILREAKPDITALGSFGFTGTNNNLNIYVHES